MGGQGGSFPAVSGLASRLLQGKESLGSQPHCDGAADSGGLVLDGMGDYGRHPGGSAPDPAWQRVEAES